MVYNFREYPLKVYGVPNFEQTKRVERLPQELREKVPSLQFLGRRCLGARVRFQTNAISFTVQLTLENVSVDIGMSIFAAQAACVFIGNKGEERFVGLVYPKAYGETIFQATFEKSAAMEEVTIYLPRNEVVLDCQIQTDDSAIVKEPTPYTYEKPIAFYGSSIVEGGAAGNVANNYPAILSRRLDMDFYNFGFSGNAKGELPIAEYLGDLDCSAYVIDYDHNAPTKEHLANTHYAFYKRLREKKTHTPILIMSRPKAVYNDDDIARREIIMQTYCKARQEGDSNIYFLDGETFFSGIRDAVCLVDGVHPNDLGFYRMANAVEPKLRIMLKGAKI